MGKSRRTFQSEGRARQKALMKVARPGNSKRPSQLTKLEKPHPTSQPPLVSHLLYFLKNLLLPATILLSSLFTGLLSIYPHQYESRVCAVRQSRVSFNTLPPVPGTTPDHWMFNVW